MVARLIKHTGYLIGGCHSRRIEAYILREAARELLTHWTVNLDLIKEGHPNSYFSEQHVQSQDLTGQNAGYLQFKLPMRGS